MLSKRTEDCGMGRFFKHRAAMTVVKFMVHSLSCMRYFVFGFLVNMRRKEIAFTKTGELKRYDVKWEFSHETLSLKFQFHLLISIEITQAYRAELKI